MGGPTEEWGAVVDAPEPVGVDFGPVDALPLPVGLQILLESLQASRMQHTPRLSGTLAEHYQRLDRQRVQARLGFTFPRLSALLEAGQLEMPVGTGGHEPRAPGDVAPYQSDAVTVLYLPDETILHRPNSLERAPGVTFLQVSYGHTWAGDTPEPARTTRSRASGDATGVDVHGYRIGVQHRRKGLTRLAWTQQFGDVPCVIVVHSPHTPRKAVEMLVQCDLFTVTTSPAGS